MPVCILVTGDRFSSVTLPSDIDGDERGDGYFCIFEITDIRIHHVYTSIHQASHMGLRETRDVSPGYSLLHTDRTWAYSIQGLPKLWYCTNVSSLLTSRRQRS